MGNGAPYNYNPYIMQPASLPPPPPPPLPVDEDDYLQPKSANPKAYLDLENSRGIVASFILFKSFSHTQCSTAAVILSPNHILFLK